MNWKAFVLFLVLNFGALGIGGFFTGDGVTSDWYAELNKAPWTPPGWVFGAAWTTIMVCFTFYMTALWNTAVARQKVVALFIVQWCLNVIWNPVFFYKQWVVVGLIVISALTLLTGFFLIGFKRELKWKAIFVLPYFLWLLIATSLNAYIYLYN